MTADLREVSTSTLRRLREGLVGGWMKAPVTRVALLAAGIREQLDALETSLGGHRTAACLAIVEGVLSERLSRHPSPELVWTGPEAPLGSARDTAVVLGELFEQARESVVLAGYSFDHAHDVLRPLFEAMRDHGVQAWFFVDVPQIEHGDPQHHVDTHLGKFWRENWPFGAPKPRVFYDKRAVVQGPPWSSLHAKCVAVDGKRAMVSSANFTQRGQERNIETGVLLNDPAFASQLANQWMALVGAGLVVEWSASTV